MKIHKGDQLLVKWPNGKEYVVKVKYVNRNNVLGYSYRFYYEGWTRFGYVVIPKNWILGVLLEEVRLNG